jgi:P-type Cu2+ transporter
MPTSASAPSSATAVLHVGRMYRGSEDAPVEAVLGRRPGVIAVEANAAAQTATVTYDPSITSVHELRRWVEECGYNCAGQSVPGHIRDPLMEPGEPGDEFQWAGSLTWRTL